MKKDKKQKEGAVFLNDYEIKYINFVYTKFLSIKVNYSLDQA